MYFVGICQKDIALVKFYGCCGGAVCSFSLKNVENLICAMGMRISIVKAKDTKMNMWDFRVGNN